MGYIEFENVDKSYGKTKVLKNISFSIKKGEIVSILGESGSGKSTILESLCGFKEIDNGKIYIDGEEISKKEPKDRDISMIFQNYALMPHLNVYENIALGMKIRKEKKKDIERKVLWAADILELTKYLKRKPKELSGGQKQRVAIGRGIVRNPKVFLMDEPLSNLDYNLKMETAKEIVSLNKKINGTTIYVTHDQEEAILISDRLIIIRNGEIEQIGTPEEIYKNPENKFVAEFLGRQKINFLKLTVGEENYLENIKINLFEALEKGKYTIGVRPENIKINENGFLEGIIEDIRYLGSEYLIKIDLNGKSIRAKILENKYKAKDRVKISFDLDKINIFRD
ncbi:ABC transporter ATP-binding protein [uncultured Clostridium sp.]|uniref:ABC transporter ATP-binding protein n=1 Tax=uncultured Clostridium sp. TaxID=59620 RepID=UPI00261F7EA3|nr:ABC transporter ATP-binding protein [uncultured Clostridium sp.]